MAHSTRKIIRTTISLSVDDWLVSEANRLNLDLSATAEAGIAKAISEEKMRRWRRENRDLIRRLDESLAANSSSVGPHRPS